MLTSKYAFSRRPQAIYNYAMAFSAGLNGLQVDKVSRENNSQRFWQQTVTYIVFLHVFITALFLHFLQAPSLLEIKFRRNVFP